MIITYKNICIRLTKQDNSMLEEIKKELNTSTTDIIKRALINYYEKIINKKLK